MISSRSIPCVRHGEPGVQDPQLIELLNVTQQCVDVPLAAHLGSLNALNEQLWVTWKDDFSRTQWSRVVDQNWRALGQTGPILHLIPVDESYDYQEDVMNNADRD